MMSTIHGNRRRPLRLCKQADTISDVMTEPANKLESRLLPLGVLCLLGIVFALRWWAFQTTTLEAASNFAEMTPELPVLQRTDEYVSSSRCAGCHPREHASWHETYHRTMTQVAVPENVVGKFDGTTISSNGLPYTVYREGDKFWATMPDPEIMMYVVQGAQRGMTKKIDEMTYLVKKTKGSPVERLDLRDIPLVRRRVLMTTGSHHYQTYWVDGSEKYGRLLQTLPLIYLINDRRWIPREAAFMHPPGVSHMITQWNDHCIKCHSTGGIPGLDKNTGKFATQVAEMGIACEACHGPGDVHIRQHRNPLSRYRLHFGGKSDPTIVNPSKLSHRASSQVCGQCHGVFINREAYAMKYAFEGVLYHPGEDLHKTRYYIQHPANDPTPGRKTDLDRNPEFFRQRWWDDGMVLAGGREFSAMSVSKCYLDGQISCLSCHSMHDSNPADQLKENMHTVMACTQCHDQAKYTSDIESHTFHAADSAGSNCLNCHMPYTSYALLGAIRSHQIAAPNTVGSIRHGTPNACNLCHLDKTIGWTQNKLSQWYGHEKIPLQTEQQSTSAALLWMLKGNAAQRVITAWHFGWQPAHEASGSDWLAPFQAQLLRDPYGVVRYVAADNLGKLPGFDHFQYDFLAPPDELRRQVDKATQQWYRSKPASLSQTGPEICVDSAGNVMEAKLRQLIEQRDNRQVSIME